MKGTEIKLGYAPTRRSIFSAPDAIKYRGLTKDRLLELGVSFVDIDGINPEGLLYDDKDVAPVLYEACKYLGVKPDLYDNNEEQVKAYLRGE